MDITLELSNLVATMSNTQCLIYIPRKKLATCLTVSKTLIKYNSKSLEYNDEEEKEPIDIKFTEQKADPLMMKMLLTLNDRI